MSMRVMSAGKGVKYLLSSVVTGDNAGPEALTRYYSQKGTPPGRWMGSDLGAFGDGSIQAGDTVLEEQLRALIGRACDPLTGQPLGRRLANYKTVEERIDDRIAVLSPALTTTQKAEAITDITAEELDRGSRNAVAAFDHTFSVPKSVSVLWAVGAGEIQEAVLQAHYAATSEVLRLIEREVAATRIGIDGGDGSVRQVPVMGLVATAYDHYESRSSDPQLHTHVVIANRARAAPDPSKWRTLDGRPIHEAVVALSETYNAVLADRLSQRLGVEWELRDRGDRRAPSFEIVGVPDDLIEAFSSRSRDIDQETDRLVAAWSAAHDGGRPSEEQIIRFRARATLSTRPEKQVHAIGDLMAEWQDRAAKVLGESPMDWATELVWPGRHGVEYRSDDVPLETLMEVAGHVIDAVRDKRSTWRHWNLYAEAARHTTLWRFATAADREQVLAVIVSAAEQASVAVTPGEIAFTPSELRRSDGTSQFRPRHSTAFTSRENLEAEARLLALAADTSGLVVPLNRVEQVTSQPLESGVILAGDQALAATKVALSGRKVDVMVGAAGTGKTSTLAALRAVWEIERGPGSVVGLAPTAVAAQVLAEELGIQTENTAKWDTDHARGEWDFTSGQLVLVDEATMAGTFLLDRLTRHAAEVGAKVLLVGDDRQHAAVDAGGAFALLKDSIDDHAELTEVWRFASEWEKAASLRLRLGEQDVIGEYADRGRIADGGLEAMLDAGFAAWRSDVGRGRVSLMIAETNDTARALNLRARLDRLERGVVKAEQPIRLHDGTEASTGDVVLTRQNNRHIRFGDHWVKNGDLWEVLGTHADGSIDLRPMASNWGWLRVPAEYVREHVELGYAVTSHRAQGATIDTAHAIVASGSMTRESLYVSMTRGRDENRAYVATDQAVLEEHQRRSDGELSARSILARILANVGAEQSAHATMRAEQERWTSIAQLAAEYETIAQLAQRDRWLRLLVASGLDPEQVRRVSEEESFGPLAAELRRAEANHYEPSSVLRRVVAEREIRESDDVAAVLRWRIQRAVTPQRGRAAARPPKLIVGLIAEAVSIDDPEMQRALVERQELMEQRVQALVDEAVQARPAWVRELGNAPTGTAGETWRTQIGVIAAYRDRWGITSDAPLGSEPATTNQRIDQARAQAALNQIVESNRVDYGVGLGVERDFGLSL